MDLGTLREQLVERARADGARLAERQGQPMDAELERRYLAAAGHAANVVLLQLSGESAQEVLPRFRAAQAEVIVRGGSLGDKLGHQVVASVRSLLLDPIRELLDGFPEAQRRADALRRELLRGR